MTGPCIFACVPVIVTYITGRNLPFKKALSDILFFLSGRLTATLVYGLFAGISGQLIRNFQGSGFLRVLRPFSGGLIILMGIFILAGKTDIPAFCRLSAEKFSRAGVFLIGFIIGISPCPPFLALFFEIALMSGHALDGVFYALFFGLGLFVSGFFVIAGLSGLITGTAMKVVKSPKSKLFFRIFCAILLFAFGIRCF